MTEITKRVTDIVKRPGDKREYCGIELSNKLRILLISDPETDKSAASMSVGVGHLMDPWELPGLAHFCEHMLFLGTEKYPIENEYKKFISQNAGTYNAYTSADKTYYPFDIEPEKLYDILDRFVQFFLSPLFTESATEREVCAVDSEFKSYLTDDAWRNWQVDRFLSKPGHDYGKFNVGNKQTLYEDSIKKGIKPRESLLKFHEECISCVILGKESLDDLENYVCKLGFNKIKNKNVDLREWAESPYGSEQLGTKIHIVPIKDTRNLRVLFPIPCFDSDYKSQPDGLEHVDEIIELIFGCIGMVRRAGYQEWIQDEMRKIGEIDFRFKNKENPFSYVQGLANDLIVRPFEDVVCKGQLSEEHKPALVEKILSCLTPEDMMCRIVAKKFLGDPDNTKEPVYGTEICIKNIEEADLKKLTIAMNTPNDVLFLPEENKFIATNFDLKPREEYSVHPQIIRDDSWFRCWYKQDDEFKLPKMECKIKISSPIIGSDLKSIVETILFIWCIDDALKEDSYNPRMAGMASSVRSDSSGIKIEVSGYNEKLPLFVECIINRLVNFKPDPLRFNVLFDSVERALKNYEHSSPNTLTVNYLAQVLSEKNWTYQQYSAVIQDINVDNMNNFIVKMLSAFHIQVFCYGNVTKQEALNLSETVCTILKSATSCRPLFQNELSPFRMYALENGDNYIFRQFQSTHDASGVKVLFHVGVQNNYQNCMVELICQIMKEPAATQLRTVEQLGYTVWSGSELSTGTVGLYVYVQGPKEPDFVLDRIDAFLSKFREDLDAMSDEEFQTNIESLVSKLKVHPKTICEKFNRWDCEMESRQFDFDKRTTQINILQDITKDELLAFYDKKFVKGAPERRKISVLLHGEDHSQDSSKD